MAVDPFNWKSPGRFVAISFFIISIYFFNMSLRAAQSTREILKHLSSGPGAAKLPSNVSKIALTFASKGKNESAGARYVHVLTGIRSLRWLLTLVVDTFYKRTFLASDTTTPTLNTKSTRHWIPLPSPRLLFISVSGCNMWTCLAHSNPLFYSKWHFQSHWDPSSSIQRHRWSSVCCHTLDRCRETKKNLANVYINPINSSFFYICKNHLKYIGNHLR